MTDDQLRALVRDAVARRLGTALPEGARPCTDTHRSAAPVSAAAARVGPAGAWQQHPSHQIHVHVINTTEACVIEPSVACDHCGYCKSHGH